MNCPQTPWGIFIKHVTMKAWRKQIQIQIKRKQSASDHTATVQVDKSFVYSLIQRHLLLLLCTSHGARNGIYNSPQDRQDLCPSFE